ncbi:MAG: hypothetical protein GX624_00405 [Actinobacteria bacterium]|nr:hypothetical protein [Actinomycetota bacterium]
MTGRFSRRASKSIALAALLLVAVALFGVMATSAAATPGTTTPCGPACHALNGTAPVVTPVSNDGVTATYSFTSVYADWAVFDGTTFLKAGTTAQDTFSGPAGHTFTVYAIDSVATGGATTVTAPGPITVTPTVNAGGTITPSTPQIVTPGSDITFTFAANADYHIADVKINGVSNPAAVAAGTYTFTNVTAASTIEVVFAPDQAYYTITSSAGPHGTITPLGPWTVGAGGSVIYLITADDDYAIDKLLVDGVEAQDKIQAGAYYTFSNVMADHTIHATFVSTLQKCTVSASVKGLKAGAVKLGKKVTIKGVVKPAHSGKATVTIQRKAGGKWVKAKAVKCTINAKSGAYSCTYKPAKKGAYRVKTTVARTSVFTAAASSFKSFKVK